MRLTFAPEESLSRQLRSLAEAEGVSLSQLVNRLLKQALEAADEPAFSGVREAAARYHAPPHRFRPMGLRAGLDPHRIKDMLAELDEDDAIAKLRGGA